MVLGSESRRTPVELFSLLTQVETVLNRDSDDFPASRLECRLVQLKALLVCACATADVHRRLLSGHVDLEYIASIRGGFTRWILRFEIKDLIATRDEVFFGSASGRRILFAPLDAAGAREDDESAGLIT